MRCKIKRKEIMCKVWTELSKLTVHTSSVKRKNLFGRYWIKSKSTKYLSGIIYTEHLVYETIIMLFQNCQD
jgi:hypothetical protein